MAANNKKKQNKLEQKKEWLFLDDSISCGFSITYSLSAYFSRILFSAIRILRKENSKNNKTKKPYAAQQTITTLIGNPKP